MAKNIFNHNVQLIPLNIENKEKDAFRLELLNIPYLLYEVEILSTGEKIVINKPGGKRNWGRPARNDFMVFIYSPDNEGLWLISHNEILEDLRLKFQTNKKETENLIYGLLDVCKGKEPDNVINERNLININGLEIEKLLKVYKWIWGQEDCNYPNAEGRWLSMNAILSEFNLKKD
jgi:hypothetical protein